MNGGRQAQARQHPPDAGDTADGRPNHRLSAAETQSSALRQPAEIEDEVIRQALAFAAASLDDKILPPVVAR